MRNWLTQLILLPLALGAYAQTTNGYIAGKNVILRSRPASYYERLAVLKEGTPVEIVSRQGQGDGQWMEVRVPESVTITGWVQTDCLDSDGKVIHPPCPVYTGAGQLFTAFYNAKEGTILKPSSSGRKDGPWMEVVLPSDATAWVSGEYVALGNPPPPPADVKPAETQAAAVAAAVLPADKSAELAKRQEELRRGEQELAGLQRQAEELKARAGRQSEEVSRLQEEAKKWESERAQTRQRIEDAARERERLQKEQSELQAQLEKELTQAKEKARLVQEDSAKWESEAQLAGEKLLALQQEAKRREEVYRAEAEAMAAEQKRSEEAALAALENVKSAQKEQEAAQAKQQELLLAIGSLQKEVASAADKTRQLRQERQDLEEAARQESERLEALRQEQQRLADENRQQLAKAEEARREREQTQAELDRLQNETTELQSRLDAARQQLEERQQAALEAQKESEKPSLEEQKLSASLDAIPVAAPGEVTRVSLSGIVVPLGANANADTSHALCKVENGKYVPLAYLKADRFPLKDWELQEVTLSGLQEIRRGWSRPLVTVKGIVLK